MYSPVDRDSTKSLSSVELRSTTRMGELSNEVGRRLRVSVRAAKLTPAIARCHRVPGDLRALLEPRAGRLVLVHAPAGYRKTDALAATRTPGAHWYNLDL